MLATIKLEDYFDFFAKDDIRLKGHRIGIEDVINYYLEGYPPEEILKELPSLNLEKIHATITYYLHNRSELDVYLIRLTKYHEERYQASLKTTSPLLKQLKEAKKQRTKINS